MKSIDDFEKKINSELASKIKSSKTKHSQIYLYIDPEDIIEVILFLKTNNETKYRQLIDITAVDYPQNDKRFQLVYLLLSLEKNQRIIINFDLKIYTFRIFKSSPSLLLSAL